MNGGRTAMWPTRMYPLVRVALTWRLIDCVVPPPELSSAWTRRRGGQQTIMDRVAEFHFRRPPKPRCRPKSRGFRQRVGNPYFEDSHRLTPKKGRLLGVRYDHLNDASDEAELGDSLDDSVDLSGGRDETVKDQIRRLSYDEAERDGGQYLEIRTHFSLDKVAEFERKRYRFDASLHLKLLE
ncbi:unnamed protein product [Phytophthora fragariaefolia]|uniref:Unnamed protein product n=1 Tax=Phytophthora fragariaefolia TaxID=1490495 RepID=A0A9W6WZF3_9STRA|nr:unnamed protein product [Phytophthora fragariaefolia]